MNAQEITKILGGHWHGSYGTARCPAHDNRGPSLSIRDGVHGEPVNLFPRIRVMRQESSP